MLESVLALLLRYDDHKAVDVVLHSYYSAVLQHQQTRKIIGVPSVSEHPKSVKNPVSSQGRNLNSKLRLRAHAKRATPPEVVGSGDVCVKILQGAPAGKEVVWFGGWNAGKPVVKASSLIFGQTNAGAE